MVAVLLAALICNGAWAELLLPMAERLAQSTEPGIGAHEERARALREEATAALSWPDPQVYAGILNLPLVHLDREREPLTQVQLGLRQAFPRAGERQAHSAGWQARADEMSATAALRRLRVVRELRLAWLDWLYQEAKRELLERTLTVEEDSANALVSAYSSGFSGQAAVQRARAAPVELRELLLAAEQESQAAQARVAQWLPIANPQGGPWRLSAEWPTWTEPIPADELRAGVAGHPQVQVAQARIATAAAGIEVAESQFQPSFSLEATYGLRSGGDPLGRPRTDLGSVRVTMDLPIFTSRRQQPRLRSAMAQSAAANADEQALLREVFALIATQSIHYQQLGERLQLYQNDLIPLRQRQVAASAEAYRNASAGVADYLDSRRLYLDTQLEALRLHRERDISRIELAYLGMEEHLMDETVTSRDWEDGSVDHGALASGDGVMAEEQ